ncbi:MAG TPA: sporulation membrane protein YtrI [Bacillales bacterium]|nr:sporulation membrane protein YtrI [Bacillales bacterium]
MRIPQHYHSPGWQRFIVGFLLGAVIGWVFFITLYGQAQEDQINLINKQKDKIAELQDEKDIWLDDVKEENEKLEKKLTVQDIQVKFVNKKESELGDTALSTLNRDVEKQLSSLLTKDLETVGGNSEILIQSIENKTFEIEDNKYHLEVQTLIITSVIKVGVKIEKIK